MTAIPTSPARSAPPRISAGGATRILAAAALVAAAVAVLPGAGEVRERFANAAPGWVAAIAVLELASCLSFVLAFRGVMGRRLRRPAVVRVGLTMQGANVLIPAGGASGLAVAAWALKRTGASAERISRRAVALFLITSSVNFAAAAGAGIALLVSGRDTIPPALAIGPALAALLSLALVALLPHVLGAPGAEERSAGRLGRVRDFARSGLSDGIRDAGVLLRQRRPDAVVGAVGYMAFDVAALAAAFLAVGGMPPEPAAFVLAYALGQLGGLLPLPGGLGGTDGGLVAALVLYGAPLSAAAAAVLAYRAFQLGLPALLGALAAPGLSRSLA